MNIQRATKKELEEILKLQYLAFQTEALLFGTKDIPPLKQTLEELEEEFMKGTILIARDKGIIIGSVRMKEKDNTIYIGKLMVHPNFRKRGVGSLLLQEVEKMYPNKRYELFTSTKSTDNIRLYTKLGYKIFDKKEISKELSFVYLDKI
ncbi:MAG: GNAT family N-acetyltransferase [Succinivibrionaceae bacterium]